MWNGIWCYQTMWLIKKSQNPIYYGKSLQEWFVEEVGFEQLHRSTIYTEV